MQNRTLIALAALGGAIGLLLYSRTDQGTEFIATATDEGADFMRRASDAAGSVVQAVVDWTLPRGIRNNNPGNIDRKIGTTWKGAADDQTQDSRFVVFTAPEWGIRAMARILRTYMGRGQNTVAKIISTWAPPTENATGAYINAVARAVGLDPNAPVSDAHLPAIIAAIIQHENGQQPYPPEVIAQGVALERSA